MHLIALFTLLPLLTLTPTLALPGHDADLAQREYRQQHHRRVVQAVSGNKTQTQVKVKRKVKRANGVCRKKDGTLSTIGGGSATSSAPAVGAASAVASYDAASASASPSAASAAGTTSIAAVNYAANPSSAVASSAGTTTAAPSASASDDSLALWSSAAISASAAAADGSSSSSAAASSSPIASAGVLAAVSSSASSAKSHSSAAASSAAVASASSVAASSAVASASSAAASASASASASGGSTSSSGGASVSGKAALTPKGIKAGITLCDGVDAFVGHASWCYDWTPSPSPPSGMVGASMLWGDGSLGATDDDASRLAAFKALTTSPAYVIGPEEPDCSTSGSASMSVAATATLWNNVIAPHGAEGSLLLSPSMCHQADETFLTPFEKEITTPWDVTNLHINKIDMAGVNKDLDYYWNTYGKPMWVTEFACVEDQSWTPCTDQTTIDQFISDIVDLFEKDERVYAYAYSNGEGLGDVWPAFSNGQITASGKAYLAAISKYH